MRRPKDSICAPPCGLPSAALAPLADYFQALGEPARLKILQVLKGGELSAGELAQRCGMTPSNVSRHLSLLLARSLVGRRSEGTRSYYRITDPAVYAMCDVACTRIAQVIEERGRARK